LRPAGGPAKIDGGITGGPDEGVGTLLPDTSVRIVDDAGQTMTDGGPGTVAVRSPHVTEGYLWNEALTARHFSGGWFLTSDAGIVPAPGKLFLLGRTDDMLNVGGLKIAPYPIEEAIKSIDGVTDAVMVSHKTLDGMDELHVFIECRERAGFARAAQSVDAVIGRHDPRITAHYGTGLPRTGTGKVRREMLREHLTRGR
jgi:acyl-coenzyme A synthetase/AMP-(fatty) acid ligase